ncbi:MAG: hypothetical protein JJD92_08005 [Frankiaceae bacterium]|nr:hypothetical protein [Frankiaceae bacterium]
MTFPKGRWGFPAGPSAVLALLLLTGCAIGGDLPDTSDTPRRDLAGRPAAPASDSTAPPPSGAATPLGASADASAPSAGTGRTPAGAASAVPAGTAQPAATGAPAAPYKTIVVVDDRGGDAGRDGPPYADLRRITIDDNGSSARVTVSLAGRLPTRAADGEAIGIGVHFYRTVSQFESDYQLFADGGPDGWFAYLHTPKGFVRYPGTFELTGDGLRFTVPWSSLANRTEGTFSAFDDWTQRRTTGNAAANDRAPLLGNTSYAR